MTFLNMCTHSDDKLVKEICNGNLKAFNILYQKYSSPILNYIYKLTGNTEIAEDIFQETFIRVINNIERYNPLYRFSTWIYTIASNLCFNELKKINKNKILFQESVLNGHEESKHSHIQIQSKEKNPLERIEILDIQEKIKGAIDQLSETHKMVFIQKFYQELSYKEIAEIMNCSIGTVKSRIHYAVENLRKLLEG